MEKDAEKIFTELREDISTYAGLKLRLLKLTAIERAAGLLSAFSHGLILMLFIFFTILFLFIALGFFLGEILENIALGFLIVGGIYLLLTFCFIWTKGGIKRWLRNIFINALRTNDEEDDEEDQPGDSTRAVADGEAGDSGLVPAIGNED